MATGRGSVAPAVLRREVISTPEGGKAMRDVGEGLIATIDRQTWMDGVAERVQGAIGKAFAAGGATGRRVRDALHGTWLGHPLHPVLTDVPIGAWTTAAVLDAMEARAPWTRRGRYARGADAAVTIGLAGAAGAAVTGLTDWHHTSATARKTGLVHGVLNTVATGLYVTSLVLRKRGDRDAGRAFAWAGFGVMLASAYLGGHLVYRQRIGVNHSPEDANRADEELGWTPVLGEQQLPDGQLTRVDVRGIGVVLVRRGRTIFAMADSCAHLGGPLSEGAYDGRAISCPWHGSTFAVEDGRVLRGPATYPQPCYATRVREGQIEVRATFGEAAAA
jgi:nitrite reductase/ring-hydroxylating ferredoxin subunit/uncharacterized membrane protein